MGFDAALRAWRALLARPLAERIALLRERGVDPAVLDEEAREIETRRALGHEYGYTGYVLRRRCAPDASPDTVGGSNEYRLRIPPNPPAENSGR